MFCCTERRRPRSRGFTIIELMIVVAILGVLSALAIPSFITFVRRSRTAEIPPMLTGLFVSAASYYTLEVSSQGINAPAVTNCSAEGAISDWAPTSHKHEWYPVAGNGFETIGFKTPEYVYFAYQIDAAGRPSTCNMPASNSQLYTFRATGDLTDDGVLSTFELAVGTSRENAPYRAVSFYIVAELE